MKIEIRKNELQKLINEPDIYNEQRAKLKDSIKQYAVQRCSSLVEYTVS
jgi:hypothetical protein